MSSATSAWFRSLCTSWYSPGRPAASRRGGLDPPPQGRTRLRHPGRIRRHVPARRRVCQPGEFAWGQPVSPLAVFHVPEEVAGPEERRKVDLHAVGELHHGGHKACVEGFPVTEDVAGEQPRGGRDVPRAKILVAGLVEPGLAENQA